MEFFEGWKTLNARFDEGDLTALTQLVGYKLFVIFDEHRFPDSLPVSDRELMSRTGIQSTRTIFEARRRLKNAGLIDFETRQGKKTCYRLISKQLGNSEETVGKQLVNSKETVGEVPNIRARDPYTPNLNPLNDDRDERAGARTHARVNRNSKITEVSTVNSDNSDMDIHDVWEYETGFKLTGSVAYELEMLANEDFELVHRAIVRAVGSKDTARLRYNYFKKIYDDMKNPQPKRTYAPKGGEKHGATTIDYGEEPDTSWIYESISKLRSQRGDASTNGEAAG